jgi:hypothetical protein
MFPLFSLGGRKNLYVGSAKSEKENSIPFIFHLRARELPIERAERRH